MRSCVAGFVSMLALTSFAVGCKSRDRATHTLGTEGVAQAADGTQAVAYIADFVRQHVLGRSVSTGPIRETSSDGATETVSTYSVTIDHFRALARGFELGMKQQIVTETRTLASGSTTRSTVNYDYRYEVAVQASTGQLVGLNRTISSTEPGAPPFGPYFAVKAKRLPDGGFQIEEETVQYTDVMIEGRLRPGAQRYVTAYLDKGGKLEKREYVYTFAVDPESNRRTPVGEGVAIVYLETSR